jgi:hypothetical protein
MYKLNELKMNLIHQQSRENVTSENDNSHEKYGFLDKQQSVRNKSFAAA